MIYLLNHKIAKPPPKPQYWVTSVSQWGFICTPLASVIFRSFRRTDTFNPTYRQLTVLTVDPNVHAHGGIFDWFLLSFWPPSTIQDNAFTSQTQPTHFNLYMYLLHVRFDSVWLLSALDIYMYLGKCINILTDFVPCSHRRVNEA